MNKNLWIGGVAAVLVIGALYVAFKPRSAGAPAPASSADAQRPAAGVPLRQEFMLMVQDGKLAAGPERLTVVQGTEVTVVVTSDRDDELHLHGYDRAVKLAARKPTPLTFLADRAGRFELELHGTHAGIAAIEVQPQ